MIACYLYTFSIIVARTRTEGETRDDENGRQLGSRNVSYDGSESHRADHYVMATNRVECVKHSG